MSNYPTDEIIRFAEIFKALSNPHRLNIFLRLATCCPLGTKCSPEAVERRCVGDLGRGLGIDPTTVSHHLKELRRSGLLRMERCGKSIEYWVDRETVLALANLLVGFPLSETLREAVSTNAGGSK